PFTTTITLADVGGPSAGLMFALAIVDKLTPGALAGNIFVAGTGTIVPAGQVGSIGGIPLKMISAREAGATVFLVPAGNCAEAVQHVPAGLRLVRVNTLTDAVHALDQLRGGQQPPHC
ncbi:MAG: S16 family serine protease, partial [Pseudonocardiaceae bacterium]